MLKQLTAAILGSSMLLAAPLAAQAQTIDALAINTRDYIVTGIDLRKCAFPMCGGYFVKAVNQGLTRCADGSLQKQCHVPVVDTSQRGWTDKDRAAFTDAFAQGHALARGILRTVTNPSTGVKVDTLVVGSGWLGQASSKPTGLFYGLKSSGIVCITYPCPTITETTLNFPAKRNIAGLNLSSAGATPEQVEAGNQALFGSGLLAAGVHKTISGPAGQGQQLVASEFYLLVPDMIR
ncbi:MAG: hypothetical protein EOP40_15410 [Rubrivivax sp.]|nr:MAG: hypothetical protein EOP40_15410 [Rubrivivax sp.]